MAEQYLRSELYFLPYNGDLRREEKRCHKMSLLPEEPLTA
jgi:hypothetical protein